MEPVISQHWSCSVEQQGMLDREAIPVTPLSYMKLSKDWESWESKKTGNPIPLWCGQNVLKLGALEGKGSIKIINTRNRVHEGCCLTEVLTGLAVPVLMLGNFCFWSGMLCTSSQLPSWWDSQQEGKRGFSTVIPCQGWEATSCPWSCLRGTRVSDGTQRPPGYSW